MSENKKVMKNFVNEIKKQKAIWAILLVIIVMAFINTSFFSAYNMTDILKSASVYITIGCGVALVIVCGACDLSVGGIMCLSGIVTIQLMPYLPLWLCILCALAMGALIGFANGFFVAHQRAIAFVITLGMGQLLKGMSQVLTDGRPVSGTSEAFLEFGTGKIFGIFYISIVMIIVVVVTSCILRFTQYGRDCYAVGGEYEVAVYSGINARRTQWISFVLCGILSALGGVLLSARLNTGASTYGNTTALLINCGAVLGGTSFAGGIGGVWQTAIGVLLLAVVENALGMSSINPYAKQMVEGIIIVLIISTISFARKRQREAV